MINYIFFINFEKCLDKFEILKLGIILMQLYFTLHVHSDYLSPINKGKDVDLSYPWWGNDNLKT